MTHTPLKLRAVDAEDVQVISSLLQDAIVPVVDMLWEPAARRFIMVAQRLLPPPLQPVDRQRERICCAVTLTGVAQAQTQNIDLAQGDRMLDLLACLLAGDRLDVVFAGAAGLRLQLADWSLRAEDFGEPWPALCDPCHEDAAG